MRTGLTVAMLLIEVLAFGQGFNKRLDPFGWGYAQEAFGIERTNGGYTVISGSADYDSIGLGLYFFHVSVHLAFIDEQGNLLGEKRAWRPMHSAFPGWANCCDTIPGGGYVVGGASEDTLGNGEVYLMRFDAVGDTLWTKVFGDPLLNYYYIGRQVKRTADGGFLIVGDMGVGDLPVNGIDGFAIKTDSLGNEQWREIYGGPPPDWRALLAVDLVGDGGYYFSGSYLPTDTNGEHWVIRVDSTGTEIWSVTWGGPFSEGALQLITGSDGHPIIFSGNAHAPSYGSMRPYIAKLDSADGSIVWEREYGLERYGTVLFAGKECPNGDLIGAGGTFVSQAPNNEMGLLLRTTSSGDSLWMFTYHYQDSIISNGQGRFYDVLPTADGGFIAAGVARNPVGGPYPPGYSQDTWVVKVDSIGCIVPGCNSVGITEQVTNLLDALVIFPNPAQGGQQVTVQLSLPATELLNKLQLTLVGSDGRLVEQQPVPMGVSHFWFPLSSVSPGLYHVHLSSGSRWLAGGKLVIE
ncbi:MAG: T9SS type A sorting domain-containing protein [Flavobacteriales bacterium]|nr:T9SS type A sorting domain-containing protein [Flavobacteriales bacterium]MBK7943332.1 T9SS type A sorting domain-containing protein [Flavobacteriales bacterium]MBK8947975.1 T9SS type A sorting domain-containing protein [Flavobacteriales bacterium]MBK9699978.1 T9SS type A sorting domain-containing protein [Flavobacteriales bacterium]